MLIKDMIKTEKPRERLLQYGVENLSNSDLLSIVLRTGTKDTSVKDVSNNLLKQVGSIKKLNNIGVRELSNIHGIGPVKAITILASIELGKRVTNHEIELNMQLKNSYQVHEVFKSIFQGIKQEKLLAIYLNSQKRLITHKILFVGTLNHSTIHPREIFEEAIKNHAASIIIIHNHPSASLNPSIQDIETTKKIIESGNIIGIPLVDHLITNGEEYYSFYDKNKEMFK